MNTQELATAIAIAMQQVQLQSAPVAPKPSVRKLGTLTLEVIECKQPREVRGKMVHEIVFRSRSLITTKKFKFGALTDDRQMTFRMFSPNPVKVGASDDVNMEQFFQTYDADGREAETGTCYRESSFVNEEGETITCKWLRLRGDKSTPEPDTK